MIDTRIFSTFSHDGKLFFSLSYLYRTISLILRIWLCSIFMLGTRACIVRPKPLLITSPTWEMKVQRKGEVRYERQGWRGGRGDMQRGCTNSYFTMHFRSAPSSFSLKRQIFTSLIRNAVNTIWVIIICFEGKNVPNKKWNLYFAETNPGLAFGIRYFVISFIDDTRRQLFRGDLQRARRTLSSPRAFITYRALAIAKRKTKRRRRSLLRIKRPRSANRYHQYDTTKMHPCLENRHATSHFYTNTYDSIEARLGLFNVLKESRLFLYFSFFTIFN